MTYTKLSDKQVLQNLAYLNDQVTQHRNTLNRLPETSAEIKRTIQREELEYRTNRDTLIKLAQERNLIN